MPNIILKHKQKLANQVIARFRNYNKDKFSDLVSPLLVKLLGVHLYPLIASFVTCKISNVYRVIAKTPDSGPKPIAIVKINAQIMLGKLQVLQYLADIAMVMDTNCLQQAPAIGGEITNPITVATMPFESFQIFLSNLRTKESYL